jgi:hypothetical protein
VTRFECAGIALGVPVGWEARGVTPGGVRGVQGDGSVAYPYVHVASRTLPRRRAPYGGDVVASLGPADAFAALLEFEPAAARSALFATPGPPRRLRTGELSSAQLQRTLRGQLGAQRFFHCEGRAFCLYVVLGGASALRTALPALNGVLASLSIRRGTVVR